MNSFGMCMFKMPAVYKSKNSKMVMLLFINQSNH